MTNLALQLVGGSPTREVVASALVPEVRVTSCMWTEGATSGASGYEPLLRGTDVWWLRFANHDVRTLGDFLVGFTIGAHLKVQWYSWATRMRNGTV